MFFQCFRCLRSTRSQPFLTVHAPVRFLIISHKIKGGESPRPCQAGTILSRNYLIAQQLPASSPCASPTSIVHLQAQCKYFFASCVFSSPTLRPPAIYACFRQQRFAPVFPFKFVQFRLSWRRPAPRNLTFYVISQERKLLRLGLKLRQQVQNLRLKHGCFHIEIEHKFKITTRNRP